ncbi:MAG: malonyl-ACP O-methyltransferase BioC, partial [Gammaproteobacteria bacterium]|nr:malonyl-ACP O-methyltransferase BioC [Gammaproteobacteria bacterium]
FARAAARYDEIGVLHHTVADELIERLKLVKVEPMRVLDVGCGSGYVMGQLERLFRHARVTGVDVSAEMTRAAANKRRWMSKQRFVVGDAECLPIDTDSVDVLVSDSTLQWCHTKVALDEFWRVLKPGGVLTFSTYGPDTLQELRTSWSQADSTPHVHEFLDMHDLGDALMHAKFTDPVVDVDRITVTYRSLEDLLRDIKCLGSRNANIDRRRTLTGRDRFGRFKAAYQAQRNADNLLPVTYEVVYGHAWVPDAGNVGINKKGVATVALEQITTKRL